MRSLDGSDILGLKAPKLLKKCSLNPLLGACGYRFDLAVGVIATIAYSAEFDVEAMVVADPPRGRHDGGILIARKRAGVAEHRRIAGRPGERERSEAV